MVPTLGKGTCMQIVTGPQAVLHMKEATPVPSTCISVSRLKPSRLLGQGSQFCRPMRGTLLIVEVRCPAVYNQTAD